MTQTSPPVVSVVIPAYNVSRYIAETLDSVFSQTFNDFEIVTSNDASPDTPQLEAILAGCTDSRLRYLKHDTNLGVSAGRNLLISAARGEFIAFLDGDDKWKPEYLERMVGIMRSDPGLSVLYSDCVSFGASEFIERTHMSRSPSVRPVTLEALLTERATLVTSCVMARRQALLDVGMFDVSQRYVEDFELWCRLAANGKRFDFIEEPLAMRRGGGAQTANVVGCLTNIVTVFDKCRKLPGLSERHHKIIDDRIEQFRAELDLHLGKCRLDEKKYSEAKDHLKRANTYLKRPKLQLILTLLSVAPPLARMLNNYRKRAQPRPS